MSRSMRVDMIGAGSRGTATASLTVANAPVTIWSR